MALGRNGAFHGGSQPAGRLECWVTTRGGWCEFRSTPLRSLQSARSRIREMPSLQSPRSRPRLPPLSAKCKRAQGPPFASAAPAGRPPPPMLKPEPSSSSAERAVACSPCRVRHALHRSKKNILCDEQFVVFDSTTRVDARPRFESNAAPNAHQSHSTRFRGPSRNRPQSARHRPLSGPVRFDSNATDNKG